MQYTKPWLSYEQQADRLIARGLLCDRQVLIRRLTDVGYYRLSGYLYIFKSDLTGSDETFVSGTSLAKVWELYTFDRQLRLVTLDTIERVEVYMRTQLAYLLAEASGPFGYLHKSTPPKVETLLQGCDQDDMRRMGFGEGWRDCPLWSRWLTPSS